jgi:hypothetical protein
MQYNKIELVFASDDLNKSELWELVHDMTINLKKNFDSKITVTNWVARKTERDDLEEYCCGDCGLEFYYSQGVISNDAPNYDSFTCNDCLGGK